MICGMCRGPLGLLGVLGTRKHYQCRNCGAAYSKKVKPKKTKPKKEGATNDEPDLRPDGS